MIQPVIYNLGVLTLFSQWHRPLPQSCSVFDPLPAIKTMESRQTASEKIKIPKTSRFFFMIMV
jgi:hypothetical protein